MKILGVPVTIEHDGLIFNDVWRVPAVTVEELQILHDSFIDAFGTGTQDLVDAVGAPTAVYDWLMANTQLNDCKVSYYYDENRSGANTLDFVNLLHIYLPIFDRDKNYYNTVENYTTFTLDSYYKKFSISASNDFGAVASIDVTTSRTDVSDVGYAIFNTSYGAFLSASYQTGRAGLLLRIPEFIIDADDNIIGVTTLFIEGGITGNIRHLWVYQNSLTPDTYTDIALVSNSFANLIAMGNVPILDDDPYSLGGNSGVGGGDGTFSDGGSPVGIPALPTLSAVDTGFITLYNPSLGQLQALASYMWSGAFDLNTFKKIFGDPMQAILGLSIVPVAITAGASNSVKVGNVDTGIYMPVASRQYFTVDCGSVTIPEKWGAYLDFDPYTKLDLYLPYIGIRPVSADCIIGKSVHVEYHVDILSGACVAYVLVNGMVLYCFIGQCSSSIPITGDNWTNVINGALSIAGSIGTMVASGGVSAPMVASPFMIASTAVNTMKPSIEKSGAVSGTGGMMAGQHPYFIVTRPKQAVPEGQNHFTGYPAFITKKLGDLSGYTEIEHIHLENIPATGDELSEIETLLKEGVIL